MRQLLLLVKLACFFAVAAVMMPPVVVVEAFQQHPSMGGGGKLLYRQQYLSLHALSTGGGADDNDVKKKKSSSLPSSSPSSSSSLDRRQVVKSSIAGVLSSFLLLGINNDEGQIIQPVSAAEEGQISQEESPPSSSEESSSKKKKTIVITGSNSGIGFEAAKLLAQSGDGHTIILACRTIEKAKDAIMRIEQQQESVTTTTTSSSSQLIPAECNLASIDSIKSFANNLQQQVDTIDVLCLNAGLCLNSKDVGTEKIQRTKDGFELTVGTNHLGHFLLNHLLLPKINKAGGRIVVTASGVHDPESPGGGVGRAASLGNLEGFEMDGPKFEMVDGNSYDGDKAYKDSKLCNVLFTRELQRRLPNGIVANCFSPGLITSTGFFRNQSPLFAKAFGVIATNVAKVAETPEWGGASLAYMAISPDTNTKGEYYLSPPGSSKYGNEAFGREFAVSPVSKEAQDDAKARKLWGLSEKLVGIRA